MGLNIRPLQDRLLVKRLEKDATTKGYDGKKLIEEAKALLKKYAPAK